MALFILAGCEWRISGELAWRFSFYTGVMRGRLKAAPLAWGGGVETEPPSSQVGGNLEDTAFST